MRFEHRCGKFGHAALGVNFQYDPSEKAAAALISSAAAIVAAGLVGFQQE
jgi:hypothetical protein